MEADKRAFIPAGIVVALLVALSMTFACPQEALAIASPWGAGTSYNAKTQTLTVKSGKHAIKSLTKVSKGKYYRIDKLVVKGGTTKLNPRHGYLRSLKVSKGKLTSSSSISILGNMRVSGGTVAVSSSKRYGYALNVSEDLTVTGGKVTSKTTKEGCTAISVSGDMRVKKGTVIAIAKGKSADGLQVSGFLKVYGGNLKSTTAGKYGTAVDVFGDLLMSSGSISATSGRGGAIQCSDLLRITGGKVSAIAAPGEMAMTSGEAATVKPSCLGAIKGGLPVGAQFSVGGVTYCVTDRYGPEAKVVSGGAGAGSVSFGGVTYSVESMLTVGSMEG